MQVTNRHGLPQAFQWAWEMDQYSKDGARYSVTELIGPPQIAQLLKRHDHEITVDITDVFWMLDGTATHTMLEAAARGRPGVHAETRLHATWDGVAVSGCIDLMTQDPLTIWDYKNVGLHSVSDGPKPEWVAQLNLYATLARDNGVSPSALKLVAKLRDWKHSEARMKKDYPRAPAIVMDIPMWSEAQCREYISRRITAHEMASTMPDHLLPPCAPDEQWRRGESWAALKPGAKRASKVFQANGDPKEAERQCYEHAKEKGLTMEHRPGEAIRCEYFCAAREFCCQRRRECKSITNKSGGTIKSSPGNASITTGCST